MIAEPDVKSYYNDNCNYMYVSNVYS